MNHCTLCKYTLCTFELLYLTQPCSVWTVIRLFCHSASESDNPSLFTHLNHWIWIQQFCICKQAKVGFATPQQLPILPIISTCEPLVMCLSLINLILSFAPLFPSQPGPLLNDTSTSNKSTSCHKNLQFNKTISVGVSYRNATALTESSSYHWHSG